MYWSGELEEHEEVREKLLSKIDEARSERIVNNKSGNDEDDYTAANGDYHVDRPNKYYAKFLFGQTKIRSQIEEVIKNKYGIAEISGITDAWFQQYKENDAHEWHIHGNASWACVYYLELPEGAPGTEIKEPFTEKILRPDVSEGDILIFPGQTMHRSPPNEVDKRKTIIAFNLDCSSCHPDG